MILSNCVRKLALEKADAELLAMGVRLVGPCLRGTTSMRDYELGNAPSTRGIGVSIRGNQELKAHSTPKSSENSSPDSRDYHRRDGWVTVEIIRERLRSWPPRCCLVRVEVMLRRAASKPPSQKKNAGLEIDREIGRRSC